MLNWNYVINLDRREDRWNELKERINKTLLKNEKFIRYSAFDGSKYEEELKRLNLEEDPIIKYVKNKKMKIPKGVFGCYMSHYTLLKTIFENVEINKDEWVGVFEDDFFTHKDTKTFNKLWKRIKESKNGLDDLDMIYLGGRFASGFMVPIHDFYLNFDMTKNPNIFRRKNIIELVSINNQNNFNIDRTTTAYIIKKENIPKILKGLQVKFVKKNKDLVDFVEIDKTYPLLTNLINTADHFPHLFWSPPNYQSDIQGDENIKNVIQF